MHATFVKRSRAHLQLYVSGRIPRRSLRERHHAVTGPRRLGYGEHEPCRRLRHFAALPYDATKWHSGVRQWWRHLQLHFGIGERKTEFAFVTVE